MTLAKQLRKSDNPSAAQRTDLKTLVVEALGERLQQQRHLADQLEQRLTAIRAALADRESNRDKIIKRRVEELLDPAIQWNDRDSTTR